jgi:hypothetical protein
MIPEEIYELGNMVGLDRKDIKNLLTDTSRNTKVPFSPIETYKNGGPGDLYGTISINDF